MRASRPTLLSILLGMTVALAIPTRGEGQETHEQQTVQVIAENRTDLEVRVYALQNGHMVPLEGLIPGMGNATLSLPPFFAESGEPIQFVADLIGSNEWYKSEPVAVSGDKIEFTIENDLIVVVR